MYEEAITIKMRKWYAYCYGWAAEVGSELYGSSDKCVVKSLAG
jgi:hypothetical protein